MSRPRVVAVLRLFLPLCLAMPALADNLPPASAALPVDGMALLRTWAPPEYPPDALKERVGGMVTIRLVVDEKGNVASARILGADDPRLGTAALAAAKKWVFTPALDAGRPVAISMDSPVLFSPAEAEQRRKPGLVPSPDQTPQPSPRTPASPSSTESADYPDSLLDRKLSGLVAFRCTVSAQGRAIGANVLVATHPDFVIPAMKALAHWEFTPSMQGDLPVQSDVDGKITFDATAADASAVLAANAITGPDGSPPANAPMVRVMVDPALPYDLLLKGEGGSAAVTFTVGEDGRTRDAAVQSATEPEFGKALVAAVEATVFVGPTDGHGAISVPLLRKADFPEVMADAKDDSDITVRLVAALRLKQVGGAQGLDARLTPVYRVAPRYPQALVKSGVLTGRAEIEFTVDRDGHARLPHVVSATSEEFGWAAATAVAQWIFKVPTRGGNPVDVRVKIPFDFKAPTG
jgi:TonB family protein